MLCVQGAIENDNVWPHWSSYYDEQDLEKMLKKEKHKVVFSESVRPNRIYFVQIISRIQTNDVDSD